MPKEIDTKYIVQQARYAGEEAGAKMAEVHGRLWEGRENLAKLIVSLSSTMLVGTITFSSSFLGSNAANTSYPNLLIISWVVLFLSMCLGIVSLWHSNTLKSFRARFFNSEPAMKQEAEQLNPEASQEELIQGVLSIVKKYSDSALEPLASADRIAHYSLGGALVLFGLGVGSFLFFGALQVT
ncbi:MAG: hypothetical protein OEZ16_00820 [Chromatiales bacterium]|nr:hypothetical protein [Chromatiales bacterium]